MSFIQKQKKWNLVITLLIAVMFCFPGLAGAFHGNNHQGKGFGMKNNMDSGCGIWQNQKMVQDLGLTGDQVNKLKDMEYACREKQLQTESRIEMLQLQMDKAFSSDKVEDVEVLKLAKEISSLRGDKYVQKIESKLAVRKILTLDQMKKLDLYRMNHPQKGPGSGHGKGLGQGHENCPKNKNCRGVDCPNK
jgi:Spy/CpxP family protein refolding chaperone